MEVNTKVCNKCGEEKEFIEFHKHKTGKFGLRPECKICVKKYTKDYNFNNKESIKNRNKIYREVHKEKLKIIKKEWYKKTFELRKEYHKNYNRNYKKKKINENKLYKLKCNLRTLIGQSIRNKGFKKTSKTQQILGCSFEEFRFHLESKFETWMNWDNYGNKNYTGEFNQTWDIDHIIPTSSANTEEELIKLNHYTNLQPLCSKVNRDIKKANQSWGI